MVSIEGYYLSSSDIVDLLNFFMYALMFCGAVIGLLIVGMIIIKGDKNMQYKPYPKKSDTRSGPLGCGGVNGGIKINPVGTCPIGYRRSNGGKSSRRSVFTFNKAAKKVWRKLRLKARLALES